MIVRNYLLLLFIVLASTLSAQINLTAPKEDEMWMREAEYEIAWDSYNVDGNIKIEWSNSGYWNSWSYINEVPVSEGYVSIYVLEGYGGKKGVFYINISSVDQPSLSDKVKIKISDSNSQSSQPSLSSSEHKGKYLLITKYDKIRAGPGAHYDIIGNCDVDEYYPVIERQGNWYKIQLPYRTAYTHNSNGYIMKLTDKISWENLGLIWKGTGEYKLNAPSSDSGGWFIALLVAVFVVLSSTM